MADARRSGGKMISNAEQRIAQFLRMVLENLPNGADLPRSIELQEALYGLEFFLPKVIGEIHAEWKRESFDGILPLVARKIAECEVEIFGHCILISDQTMAPFHLRLRVGSSGEEISWLECKVGERGTHGMMRTRYDSPASTKRLYSLRDDADVIDWAFKVTFGPRIP
jgi:hypothetical protein